MLFMKLQHTWATKQNLLLKNEVLRRFFQLDMKVQVHL